MAKMGKDVFVALAAIGWADGQLDAEEADAIVRAAVEEGLELDEIAEIERATSSRIELGTIDRAPLSKLDRLFVWSVARWIAQLDGTIGDEEDKALAELGNRLGLPDRVRAGCEGVVKEIADLPDGDRPLRYDLARLRVVLGDRLGSVSGMPSVHPGSAK